MSLADRKPPTRVTKCSVGILIDLLEDDEAAALRRMLAAREWSAASLAEALRDEGHPASEQQIGRHRRTQCGCSR